MADRESTNDPPYGRGRNVLEVLAETPTLNEGTAKALCTVRRLLAMYHFDIDDDVAALSTLALSIAVLCREIELLRDLIPQAREGGGAT